MGRHVAGQPDPVHGVIVPRLDVVGDGSQIAGAFRSLFDGHFRPDNGIEIGLLPVQIADGVDISPEGVQIRRGGPALQQVHDLPQLCPRNRAVTHESHVVDERTRSFHDGDVQNIPFLDYGGDGIQVGVIRGAAFAEPAHRG